MYNCNSTQFRCSGPTVNYGVGKVVFVGCFFDNFTKRRSHVAMSKRNITYIKPEEPSFLRKLKEQAGYVEGPTVDTKREDLGPVRDEDLEDNDEELPTVVVLKPGDLTAEEANREKLKLEKEADETPANLDCPIVFKVPKKKETDTAKSSKRSSDTEDKKAKKAKQLKIKSLLSFDDEEDE